MHLWKANLFSLFICLSTISKLWLLWLVLWSRVTHFRIVPLCLEFVCFHYILQPTSCALTLRFFQTMFLIYSLLLFTAILVICFHLCFVFHLFWVGRCSRDQIIALKHKKVRFLSDDLFNTFSWLNIHKTQWQALSVNNKDDKK